MASKCFLRGRCTPRLMALTAPLISVVIDGELFGHTTLRCLSLSLSQTMFLCVSVSLSQTMFLCFSVSLSLSHALFTLYPLPPLFFICFPLLHSLLLSLSLSKMSYFSISLPLRCSLSIPFRLALLLPTLSFSSTSFLSLPLLSLRSSLFPLLLLTFSRPSLHLSLSTFPLFVSCLLPSSLSPPSSFHSK